MSQLFDFVHSHLEQSGTLLQLQTSIRNSILQNIRGTSASSSQIEFEEEEPEFKRTETDRLVIQLILEFLEFYKLTNTRNIFQAECKLAEEVQMQNPVDLMKKVGMRELNVDKPLLTSLIAMR